MDPSISLAQISDTLVEPPQLVNLGMDPGSDLSTDLSRSNRVFENSDLRVRVVKLESAIAQLPQLSRKKAQTNPAQGLYQFQFASSLGLNLASIDANLGVNGWFSLIREFEDSEFFYAVTGDDGQVAEYIQYRRPNSVGYGLGETWREELFSRGGITGRPNFVPFNGSPEDLVQNLQLQFENGIDVFFGFSGDLVSDAKLALQSLKTEGNLVLRTGELTSAFDHDLLFLLATVFKRLSILKPLSSDPTSPEQFVVGIGLRPATGDQLQILEEISRKNEVESFLKTPEDFDLQVQEISDELLRARQHALYAVLAEGKVMKPELRLDRVLRCWGVSRNRRKSDVIPPELEPIQRR